MTNDEMDDAVEEWHNDCSHLVELTAFLMSRFSLTYEQVVHWIETAELP